jgi:drug/metabolite transporter (DMT)-like permease
LTLGFFVDEGEEALIQHLSKWLGTIAVLLGATCYGILNTVIKLAFDEGLTPAMITVVQLFFGSIVMWTILLLKRDKLAKIGWLDWVRISLLGIIGLTLTSIFSNLALERLSVALTIVLLFQSAWITVVLEWLFGRNKPSLQQLLATIIVLTGTVISVGISADDIKNISFLGLFYGFLSGMSFSLFLFFSGRVRTNISAIHKSAIMLSGSFVVVVPTLILLFPTQIALSEVSYMTWLKWGVPLSIVGSIVPLILMNWGLARVGSTIGATISPFEIPVSAWLAWLILGERIVPQQLIGICLIIVGIIFVEWPLKRQFVKR